jgi:hypothetical protein
MGTGFCAASQELHTLFCAHAQRHGVPCCAVCCAQITNSATLKKMMKSKKQRKLLKKADTTMVDAS